MVLYIILLNFYRHSFIERLRIIGYFSNGFTKHLKKKRLRNLLGFKKDDVEILIPTRYGKLLLDSSNDGATELIDSFVTKAEMDALLVTKEMLNELGLPTTIANKPSPGKNNNIFCIGGPLSNPNTANYFRIKTIFKSLTFGVLQDSQYLSERNLPKLKDLVHEDIYEDGIPLGTIRLLGEEIFKFEREHKGYILLVKLSEQIDFGINSNGVIHICFGNNSITTYSAVSCYRKYNKDLANILENKSHYCLLIECDKVGNIDFTEYKDLTDLVLIKSNKVK